MCFVDPRPPLLPAAMFCNIVYKCQSMNNSPVILE